MFCPHCGTNNEDTVRFCFKCGKRLREDTEKAAVEGPLWRDFAEPGETAPEPEPEAPPPPPQAPPSPQVVIGRPKRKLPIASILLALVGGVALAGIVVGGYVAATEVDWGALPLLGDEDGGKGSEEENDDPGRRILGTFNSACKDASNADCSVRWDITEVTRSERGLTVGYDLRPTGVGDCTVVLAADQQVTARDNQAGKPGIYLEGGRARLYPLTGSSGVLQAGGNVRCGQSATGTWTFALPANETTVKLRYPGLEVVRIDTALNPPEVRLLPANDPINVIPLQGTTCRTVTDQPCRGAWEIGPFGLDRDGVPVVFFAVRYEGTGNCQVNWQADVPFHAAEIAAGRPGIRLEILGDLDLLLTGAGGIGAETKNIACGDVHFGSWTFAKGNVPQALSLIYPDFPKVSLPIRP